MTKCMIIDLQKGSAAQFSFDGLNYSLSQDEVGCLIEKGVLATSERATSYFLSVENVEHLKTLNPYFWGDLHPGSGDCYGCHRCRKFFPSSWSRTSCPYCQSNTWNTFTLLYCCECHALFEYYWHPLAGGNPYDRFPGCPACKSERWCPAENERLKSLPPKEEIQAQVEAKRQQEAEAFTRLMELRKQQELKRLGLQTRPSQSSPDPLFALLEKDEQKKQEEESAIREVEALYASIEKKSRSTFWNRLRRRR